MNIYAYKCDGCGNSFNIEASLEEKESGDGEKFVCPKCGSKKITSHFSVSNFFKNVFAKDDDCGCSSGGSCCGGSENGKGKGGCCS